MCMEGLSVWEQSGVVIISGLLIVFIGLVLLILVIWVMGSIAKAVQNRGQKPAPPAAPPAPKRLRPRPRPSLCRLRHKSPAWTAS